MTDETEALQGLRKFLSTVRGLAALEDDLTSLVGLQRRVQESEAQLASLHESVIKAEAAEELAKRSAADTIADANLTIENAKARAKDLTTKARADAEAIAAQAQVDAERRAAKAVAKLKDTNEEINKANAQFADLAARIAAAKDQFSVVKAQIEALGRAV